eukprot:4338594-Ditylum_brightwellii.AAC.1
MPYSCNRARIPQENIQNSEKYIQNIRKRLRLGSREWILQMIKLNDYLVHFLVPDGVEATKKLKFKKEGFDLSSSTFKEYLDMYVHLEEAELQKLLGGKIACVRKEHDDNRKGKCQDKPKLCHKRCHSLGKLHQGKRKKILCNYHGLCYHDTDKCNFVQAHRKHVQSTHHITEQQRLRQVWFVKDAKRQTKSAA